ncbi:MAG: hypothetical protein RLY86_698 [Pseudomonadota bacterium]|jgi:hypothetical protein
MAFTWKEKLVLLKTEATYGTNSTPTAAANAVKTVSAQITPVEGDEVVLEIDNQAMGAPKAELAGIHVQVSFDVPLSGSGTAGTAPSWGAVLRACGFAETVTVGTDVAYTPINTGHESASLIFQMKGVIHTIVGFRAKAALRAAAKNYLFLQVSGRGLLRPITSGPGSLPAATYTGARELLVGSANTDFSLDAATPGLQELTVDLGNEPQGRFLVGQESIELPDPVPVGTANFEDPGMASKDWFAIAAAATPVAMSLVHGTVAGNIVEIAADAVQLGPKLGYQEQDRYRHFQAPLRFLPHANGPLTITVR